MSKLRLLCVLSFAVGFAAAANADDSLKRVQQAKSVRIGFANEAPFTFQQADATLSGADYEVARLIFGRLGVTNFEGVLVNFGSLIPGLNAGRFDVVGGRALKERCGQVLFSDPNLVISDALIVKAGNPKKLHSFKDITANPTVRVGGTTGGAQVKNAIAGGVPEQQIIEFPDVTSSLASLKAGRTDGALQTTVTGRWTVTQSGDKSIEIADPFLALKPEGSRIANFPAFAFAKADKALREAFNLELRKVLGSPEHLSILQRFGMTRNEVPDGTTVEDVCG